MNDGGRTATYITPLLECVDMNKATTLFLLDVVCALVVISYAVMTLSCIHIGRIC